MFFLGVMGYYLVILTLLVFSAAYSLFVCLFFGEYLDMYVVCKLFYDRMKPNHLICLVL